MNKKIKAQGWLLYDTMFKNIVKVLETELKLRIINR